MKQERPQLGRFLARADNDGEASLYIYDLVGETFFQEGITAKQVAASLQQFEQDGAKALSVYINSPGGNVFEGLAIHNLLKRFSGAVTVYVDGLAASIASIVAMAGSRIHMGSGAMMMIHDPSALPSARGVGTAREMRAKADELDKVATAMAATYAERTKKDDADVRTLMRAETWMTAAEAIANGFADEQFEQESKETTASAFSDSPIFASFHNVPPPLRQRPKPPPEPIPKEQAPMKNLLAKLGLSEAATEAQALTAFDHMVGASRKLIEVTGAATEGEALGTVSAWKSSHEKVGEMTARLAKIEAETSAAEVKALVDSAIKDGKAAPAQRESLMLLSPESLKAFVAAAPPIHKAPIREHVHETDAAALTAEEEKVCRDLNRDPKLFLAAKQKAIAEGRAPNPGVLAYLAAPAA